jgi:hypothetical protein
MIIKGCLITLNNNEVNKFYEFDYQLELLKCLSLNDIDRIKKESLDSISYIKEENFNQLF